jgi:hypothetical protein
MDSILFIQPNADWITHREWTQSYLYSLMQTGLHIEKGLNPTTSISLMQTGLHIENGLNSIYTA